MHEDQYSMLKLYAFLELENILSTCCTRKETGKEEKERKKEQKRNKVKWETKLRIKQAYKLILQTHWKRLFNKSVPCPYMLKMLLISVIRT